MPEHIFSVHALRMLFQALENAGVVAISEEDIIKTIGMRSPCTCPLIDDNTMGLDPECPVHGALAKTGPDKCNSCELELTSHCPIRTGNGCDLYRKGD